MSFLTRCCVLAVVTGGIGVAGEARAQSLPPWEVEVHAGGRVGSSTPTGGTPIAQFPIGESISTPGGAPLTRAISSWYFGDGAHLLNDVNAGFRVPGRITPLDAAINRAIWERREGAAYGARVARYLTSRLALELNVDYAPSKLSFTDDVAPAIEATRATFIPAWRDLLGTGFTFNTNVTSTSAIENGTGHDITTTGALRFHFPAYGGVRPYVTGGGGTIVYSGKPPSATLTGQYGFLFANTFPISERDVATVSLRTKDRVAVGLVGGGAEYDFSKRHGLRFDARLEFHPSRVDTVVSAQPSVTTQSPAFVVVAGFNPAIQFSNVPSLARPTLSGPNVDQLATFTGKGTSTRLRLSAGYVLRF